MDDNARLRRVEDKIDDLQKAIIALAKVEVKIETIFSRQTSIEDKVNEMGRTIQTLSNKANNRFSERVFWIIVCAAVSTVVRLI
tara:strand:+ start:307 stop:558 length:252 start_codon:yes stop_codon:yes gene_type:complete